jgi:hypothetical protein
VLCAVSDRSVTGGQAYFVSDGAPVSSFDHFAPIIASAGFPKDSSPSIHIPHGVMYTLAFLLEMVFACLPSFLEFTPLLSRAEVHLEKKWKQHIQKEWKNKIK